LRLAGLSPAVVLGTLGMLNALSFLACVALLVRVLRDRGRDVTIVAVLVVLTSPLPWYATSNFNEMLATLLITGFTAAVLLDAPPLTVALLFFGAGIAREVAFAPLLVLGACAWLARPRPGGGGRSRAAAAIALGCALTLAFILAFNWLRFASFVNPVYAEVQRRLAFESVGERAGAVLSNWLSPN